MCELLVEKSYTIALPVRFSLTLISPGPVLESRRFTLLVDTDNGDGHSGGIVVAHGIGYCIGEAISD